MRTTAEHDILDKEVVFPGDDNVSMNCALKRVAEDDLVRRKEFARSFVFDGRENGTFPGGEVAKLNDDVFTKFPLPVLKIIQSISSKVNRLVM